MDPRIGWGETTPECWELVQQVLRCGHCECCLVGEMKITSVLGIPSALIRAARSVKTSERKKP